MESNMSWMKKTVNTALVAGALAALPILAQSQPAKPNTPEYLCSPTPTADEVASIAVDSEGYTPLFDGASWKGLWQDCQSSHSNDKVNGAIWMISPTEKAIYSTQRGSQTGGLLLTKKKYGNYEVTFEMWPTFGDDGGFFNRVTPSGVCYQTVMDYIYAASFGGTWPEAGYQGSYDFRPSLYSSLTDPKQLNTAGNSNDNDASKGGGGGWTKWTAKAKPAYLNQATAAELGCAATGCTAEDWNRMWNFNGWNQVRIRFYGGTAAGTGKIHMQSFFRKLGATIWTPIWADSITKIDPPSFIGLQVHGGGRFPGVNWYRNYRLRELTDDGQLLHPVKVLQQTKAGLVQPYALQAVGGFLSGSVDMDHTITVHDMSGRVLETFSGRAGAINYAFTSKSYGVLMLDIATANGVTHQRVSRL